MACLDAAPHFDQVVNLGDVVGYGASPNEVCEISRQLSWATVRGNHDKVCSGIESTDGFNPYAAAAALWTREKLAPENLEWLRRLPSGPLTNPDLDRIQFVHGSPLDEDMYTVSRPDASEVFRLSGMPVTFFGHTHIQGAFFLNAQGGLFELRPGTRDPGHHEQHTIYLDADSRYLINPGSVGQPRDGDWRAGFAIYDSDRHTVTFHRLPYNVRAAQQRIRDARLPERLAARLAEGH